MQIHFNVIFDWAKNADSSIPTYFSKIKCLFDAFVELFNICLLHINPVILAGENEKRKHDM